MESSDFQRIQGLLVLLLTAGFPVSLSSQEFDRFEDHSRRRVEQFIGRADRLNDEQAWSNYVQLGVATERIAWEQEAYEQLQRKIEDIEDTQNDEDTRDEEIARAEADFEDARQQWEQGAEDFMDEERGRFLAREEALDVARDAARRFDSLFAEAELEATLPRDVNPDESPATVVAPREKLEHFDRELEMELSRARATAAGLTGVERDNFEEELAAIEQDLRREYEIRKHYFLAADAEDDAGFIAVLRADDLVDRPASAAETAVTAREELVTRTRKDLSESVEDTLKQVRTRFDRRLEDATTDVEIDEVVEQRDRQAAEFLEESGRIWDAAARDLERRRNTWVQERGTPTGAERQAWSENVRALRAAREEWHKEFQKRFEEIRKRQARRLEQQRSDDRPDRRRT